MPSPSRREFTLVAGLLLVALALRVIVVTVQFDQLSEDRDGYREIAVQLLAGNGFSRSLSPGSPPQRTAYRPPTYPYSLACIFYYGAGDVGIAVFHLLLGVLTVLFTYLIGRSLGLGWAAFVAAGLVAFDPLLLQYTSLTMTETYCTFLVTLLLWLMVELSLRARGGRLSKSMLFWTGTLFAICFLCRPTVGAFALLGLLWWITLWLRKRETSPFRAWPAILTAAIVISPWMIRNHLEIGRATPATTHGGYTLLLGNNPVFYQEVVAKPWGTVWDDAAEDQTQAAWLRGVEADLRDDLGERSNDEPSRDRWMYDRAWENIRAEPGMFLRACVLRFVRFWNIVPLAPARGSVPQFAVVGVGLFYFVEIAAFLWGLIVVVRRPQVGWISSALMVAAFCLVHLFFWSNMRMRAPVIPAVALIAGAGIQTATRRMKSKSR